MDYLGYIGYLCYKGYRCCKDSLGSMDYMGLFPLQEVNFWLYSEAQFRVLHLFKSPGQSPSQFPCYPKSS